MIQLLEMGEALGLDTRERVIDAGFMLEECSFVMPGARGRY